MTHYRKSVEHAINMIAAMFEMPRQQVYLLLSVAIDFPGSK